MCQKIKKNMAFYFFINTRPYGCWKFQNATPARVFIWYQPNLMRTLATMGKYIMLLFLGTSEVLKNLWHIDILTWQSMENHKMWNICKTVEGNGWKFRTRGTRNSICNVLFGPGHLSSVWGHSVHFEKFLILTFSTGYWFHSFNPISSKLYGKHGNQVWTWASTLN